MTTFEIRSQDDLRIINSATKYPSIPTYHKLDPSNGSLLEETVQFPDAADVVGTEKIDGTNSRIVVLPDGAWLLGSREELLTHSEDLVYNSALGIVDALRPLADTMRWVAGDRIITFYLELYGGGIGQGARQYTKNKRNVGWRLFDIANFAYSELAGRTLEQVSGWRDRGGPMFFGESDLREMSRLTTIPLVPRLINTSGFGLPTTVAEMDAFLHKHLPGSPSVLDDTGVGEGEGIVLRTLDRSVIAKARFQDYRRTLQRRQPSGRKGK